MHSTHACGSTFVSHSFALPVVQSVLVVHGSGWQAPIVPSIFEQYFPGAQCVAPSTLRHPSMHLPVAVWVVSQTWSVGQLVSPEHPLTHWCVVVLQTWPPVQSPLFKQPTHWFDTGSHLPVAPPHVVASTHGTHCPFFAPLITHAGPPVAPVQSPGPPHAWQTCVVVLHVGEPPAQSVLALHPTQVPLGVSHTCDPPVHCETLLAEHCPHAPEG
jgi:hypothetical protein